MKCLRCQHENEAGAKFCEECAAPLARACVACGRPLSATAKFCPECAHPTALSAVPSPAGRFASPQSYTPKHLAERILTSKAALEGERKQVTVLFADMKGSMGLLADRDPEEARKLLDPVLELMMEAVHRYEGTVNQVMADGLMALFGAPLAHEDHAVRACYAALRMQELVKRYSDGVRRTEGVEIRVRAGLNSGEVIVRTIGSDLHMDYTAVGQTTHLAARMEQLADPGAVLLAPATLGLAEDFIQVRSLGPTAVKGVSEPVDVHELMGANPARSRFQARAARGLTKFVGRAAELAQLAEALDLARRGRGQVVAVVGEPGVGKSRLFWELVHSYRMAGCLVIEAVSVAYGKTATYLPVIELLRGYFHIEPRDDLRKIREKVTGKLFSLDRALEPALSALLALLDVPVENSQWNDLDPSQRRQRTLDAVKRLLLRESHVQPLVVIVEDLHWIDGETQAVLDGLVESLPTARVLLLVNYRPEYEHSWGSKTYYRQLRLDALPSARAEELLEGLLGSDRSLKPLKRLLIERAEGNPFFLEENVRTLIETNVLIGERGSYRVTRAIESVEAPATVQTILAARIDRLPPEEKTLLQVASVIGENVPFRVLRAVADLPEERLRSALMYLRAAEFLYEASLFPDLEYAFTHGLTYQVAYGSLLQERRRALHADIVKALEELAGDRVAEQVERLAHHALRGEVWDKAIVYLRQAGEKAMARSAYREAVGYLEHALSALAHVPETRHAQEQAIDLRSHLGNALVPLGEFRLILERLHDAKPLAEALSDERRLGRIASFMTFCLFMTGDHTRAVTLGEGALDIADTLGDFPLRVRTNFYLGQAYHDLGDYRSAMDVLMRTMASLSGQLMYKRLGMAGVPAVFCRTWLVWCLAELGEFDAGLARGQEGVAIAEAVDHPFSLVVACCGVGILFLRRGDFPQAISALERALGVCQDWHIPLMLPWVASALGAAYAQADRHTEALPLLEQAVEEATSKGIMGRQSLQLAWLSEAHMLSGRSEQSLAVAEGALELSRKQRERGHEAHVLRLLGEIAASFAPPGSDNAGKYYRQARTLADRLGMRPLVAHCHRGLGKLHCKTGQREHGQQHLTTAATMYHEMGMTYWSQKVEAELKAQ
jgi:class 3 adenylate cyclase/tetratricopeptide (TPR) repeat protein